MKKALILLSGGLDSTTALYVAKEQGFNELYAITFEYGQKHDKEIKAAKAEAKPVIADPIYKTICADETNFIALPHEAFSGRIYRKEIPNLMEWVTI